MPTWKNITEIRAGAPPRSTCWKPGPSATIGLHHAIHWQNRPTFQQVVAFTHHR